MNEITLRNRKVTTFVGIVMLCVAVLTFFLSAINPDFALSFAGSFTSLVKNSFPTIPFELLPLINLIGVFLFIAILVGLGFTGLVLIGYGSQKPTEYTFNGKNRHERLKDVVYESLFEQGYDIERMRSEELRDKLREAEHLIADMNDEELREEVKKSIDELEEEIEEEEESEEEW